MNINLSAASPAGWARHASRGRWIMAPHLVVMDRLLLDLAARQIDKLIVVLPPRHGKSQFYSGYAPGWWLGTFPHDRVMLVSYQQQFAAVWGRQARDTLDLYGYDLFRVNIQKSAKARAEWYTVDGGGMICAGVGGGVTGRGADLLIFDDPIKNDKEAFSEVYRNAVWNFYQATAQTRLEPGGVQIVIQTRWHEDDLVGRLLKEEPGEWVVFHLPAIAEEDEFFTLPDWDGWGWKRQEGEPLWSARYDLDELAKRRKGAGTYWWNALYQGNPSSPVGNVLAPGLLQRYRVTDGGWLLGGASGGQLIPSDRRAPDAPDIFSTADLATSTKTSADYTVIATWALTKDNRLLLLDLDRRRVEGSQHHEMFRRNYDIWLPSTMGVESNGFQLSTVQSLRAGLVGKFLPLPITKLTADTDKVSRALTLQALIEAGMVYVPESAQWLPDLLEEMRQFPNGAHDDQVDAMSYAALKVVGKWDRRLHTY